MPEKYTGLVKWFNTERGFGFIEQDGEGEDLFVHYTAILEEGFRNLEDGQAVAFNIEQTEKGLQAKEVEKI